MSSVQRPQGLVLEALERRVGSNLVLDGLNLSVAPGECLALLGPSGCGKTTTLRLIAGLDQPSAGRIRLDGDDITRQPPSRREVGMVFQSYALYPHLTVERNLSLGMELRGLPRGRIAEQISSVLELLQLEPQRRRRPAELSGGQRQRVALARALVRKPRLFLLDEPMSNLDAQLREDLRAELRLLLCGGPQPVVYVTHDQQEAMGLADRIAVLHQGRLQQIGTPRELYDEPANLFVAGFIGRPRINVLPAEAGRIRAVRPEHLEPVAEGGLPARVLLREWQGASQLLQLDTPHGRWRMVCDGRVEVSETMGLGWPVARELCFEAGSGRRLA
ncbi:MULTISPECIES: ABC transporter ATP-binding protein [unclassified Synechococcus]|uniref:ABC transporter ATP-binding protein n=1 Tax=unclassified Synechococcus TaxID=2626047 RepID=UPI00006999DE|nr:MULTISPECIES: ABC transporter ATP-binding protein [unclassified Synechococcus]EAQ76354.1 ABC transporter for sugars, ATP binding protein [Synechococcus sp. WH 5701]WFN59436.1 ABC transporter ATP-binding protein [Synechococcus sp. CCFWC 502]CAK6695555.1 Trehalose import ATP-binding protein SugC [Synechococcus sp. CBW1107]